MTNGTWWSILLNALGAGAMAAITVLQGIDWTTVVQNNPTLVALITAAVLGANAVLHYLTGPSGISR